MNVIALLTDHHQYFLYGGVAEMRKSIDGLCGIIHTELGRQVNQRDVFIFLNKRGTHIKLLLQEADGFTLLYSLLHKGRFRNRTAAAVLKTADYPKRKERLKL